MVELDNLPIFLYIKTRKKGLISIIWQFLMLRQGLHSGEGLPPPPLFEKNKIKLSTVEPRYNEGPRDWQNMFIIARFVNLYRASFSYCLIFYYYWSKKKNSLFDQGLCSGGSSVTYIFIKIVTLLELESSSI